jgi:hypothetical protein
VIDRIDHLVYAVPDLARAIDDLEARFGVRAAVGGQHPGRGTHNALLALGGRRYLEIVARDPAQPGPSRSRWFGVDGPDLPRLVTWVLATDDLEGFAARAAAGGVALGPFADGSRSRADGTTLRWRFTDPTTIVAGGVVPFLIDWGTSAHPSETATTGVTLRALRAEHPEPDRVRAWLAALGADVDVERGPAPALVASFDTPRGPQELR